MYMSRYQYVIPILSLIIVCTGITEDSLRKLIENLPEKKVENFISKLYAEGKYEAILAVIADLHKKFPTNENLYSDGAWSFWNNSHPNKPVSRLPFYFLPVVTNYYILGFVEALIKNGEYETAKVVLPLLDSRVALANAVASRKYRPAEDMASRKDTVHQKIKEWEEIKQDSFDAGIRKRLKRTHQDVDSQKESRESRAMTTKCK